VSRVFLTAEWRDLVMLNYQVDASLVEKFVPAGTELDRWQDRIFLSLVGFRFLKTKVFGVSFPFHRNFEEVNLRFYVRRREASEINDSEIKGSEIKGSKLKRGVVFIRELVPRRAVAKIARVFYNENYLACKMSHRVETIRDTSMAAQYAWKYGGRWIRMSANSIGDPALPEPGSQEEFIAEHYWGYAAQPDGGCKEYQVVHPPWKVWRSSAAALEGPVDELYGRDFAAVLAKTPGSAFLAEGSPVEVHHGSRL
jgi:uncharacterized protein